MCRLWSFPSDCPLFFLNLIVQYMDIDTQNKIYFLLKFHHRPSSQVLEKPSTFFILLTLTMFRLMVKVELKIQKNPCSHFPWTLLVFFLEGINWKVWGEKWLTLKTLNVVVWKKLFFVSHFLLLDFSFRLVGKLQPTTKNQGKPRIVWKVWWLKPKHMQLKSHTVENIVFEYIFVFFLIRRLFYILSSCVCDGDKNEQKIHSKICR